MVHLYNTHTPFFTDVCLEGVGAYWDAVIGTVSVHVREAREAVVVEVGEKEACSRHASCCSFAYLLSTVTVIYIVI